MLSHVRKKLEKAVPAELEKVLRAHRMQFGFQRGINTLQAALYIAVVVEAEFGQLLKIYDLAKAYD